MKRKQTNAASATSKKQKASSKLQIPKLLDEKNVLLVPFGADVSKKRLQVWQEMVENLGGSIASYRMMDKPSPNGAGQRQKVMQVAWNDVQIVILSDQLKPENAREHFDQWPLPAHLTTYTADWLVYLLREKKLPPTSIGFAWQQADHHEENVQNDVEPDDQKPLKAAESEDEDGSDRNRCDNMEIQRAPPVQINETKIQREDEALEKKKQALVNERRAIFYRNNPGFQPLAMEEPVAGKHRIKHEAFICQKTSLMQQNLNAHLTDPLEELIEFLHVEKDTWRVYSYKKVVSSLKAMRSRVSSVSDLKGLWWAKARMRDKVVELLETGKLEKLEAKKVNPRLKTLVDFSRVWGVGPTTAAKLYNLGYRSIEDLRTRGQHVLSEQQKIGLKHFEDFLVKIPRAEVQQIEKTVVDEVHRLLPNATAMACGSYRRGKLSSGDCDILITDPDREECSILPELLTRLHATGFLTDDLTHVTEHHSGGCDTYMGVCRVSSDLPHRRLDIKVYPRRFYGFALLYFTGSDHFNRSMRLFARKKGWSLSDRSLKRVARTKGFRKVETGDTVVCFHEVDVFLALGLEYKDPIERNCFDIRFLEEDEANLKKKKPMTQEDEAAD